MDVRPHTNIKHRTIGYYFKICRDVMKKGRPLYYVDLYSGDGACECPEAPKTVWSPPYTRMLEESKNKGLGLRCVFNDYDRNKMDNLRNKLKGYEDFVIGTYHEDANVVYKKILNQIPPEEWSIFSLDPYNHDQLDFSTIAGIANHAAYDSRIGAERKPELIVTFMVYSILQAYKATKADSISESKQRNLLSGIDKCLGTDSWRGEVSAWVESELLERKMNHIFLKTFLKQLGGLGYDAVVFRIEQTIHKNIIYYLIFATSIPNAYRIISKNFEPHVKRVRDDKWVRQNFNFFKMARAKKEGFALLDEFM